MQGGNRRGEGRYFAMFPLWLFGKCEMQSFPHTWGNKKKNFQETRDEKTMGKKEKNKKNKNKNSSASGVTPISKFVTKINKSGALFNHVLGGIFAPLFFLFFFFSFFLFIFLLFYYVIAFNCLVFSDSAYARD